MILGVGLSTHKSLGGSLDYQSDKGIWILPCRSNCGTISLPIGSVPDHLLGKVFSSINSLILASSSRLIKSICGRELEDATSLTCC